MSCIKIFISRRLDIDSVIINNPLYIHMNCGAHRKPKIQNLSCVGDDTGDNISEKQAFYSEFTVQYWAWKNSEADYYGLCHYRRFLSFATRQYKKNERNMILEPILSQSAIKRHFLNDSEYMRHIIAENDGIVAESADVRKIATPKGGLSKTVRELWEGHDGDLIHTKDLNKLLQAIHELHPEYDMATEAYLNGVNHLGYNCYILRRELFYQLCEFQFDVLFELERQIDFSNYQGNLRRMLGYMGEIMYGIFIYEIERQKCYKIKKLPLVYFEETRQPRNLFHMLWIFALAQLTFCLGHSSELIFPKGSKSREVLKKVMYQIRGYNLRK